MLDAPLDTVFDYVADFENTNEWDPGTIETRRTGGDGGVGTTYANRSTFLGREVELAYETIVHERPHRVVLRGRNGRTTATDDLGFVAEGDGRTRMTYRITFDFPLLIGLVAPVVARRPLRALAREVVENLQGVFATPR
ncbi:SRPBCC family protein [Aeromicrobium halocynthiae]|uniref:SRPBCC family protein n=1 Tax=Aeromicrobium halocynthiae TaxID=560557 RepID=A0ABN2VZT0_9ACTN